MKLKQLFFAFMAFASLGNLNAQNWDDLHFGTDTTLDMVTWNIEHFPKSGQATMDAVAEIIYAMEVDIIAMQEVSDENDFEDFIQDLEGYDGIYGNHEYASLGYIYKTDEIEVVDIYEVLTGNSRALPRPPLVMELIYQGQEVVLYNNHLKCCGNGYLNESDEYDEETRRRDGANVLAQNMSFNFPNTPVIMLGDLNDLLTDVPAHNVFNVFLEDPDEYLFADMFIAEGDAEDWSFPNWPSHLDHILITNEIFEEGAAFNYECDIIKLDDYMSSFSAYDNLISDHRPVGIKLDLVGTSVGLKEVSSAGVRIGNYPNPFSGQTTITLHGLNNSADIEIYTMDGRKIDHLRIGAEANYVNWNSTEHRAGIYFAKLIVDGDAIAVRKMVVLE